MIPPSPHPQGAPPPPSLTRWARVRGASRGAVVPVVGGLTALAVFSILNESKEVPGLTDRIKKTAAPIDERLRGMTNKELIRQWVVYKACQVPWVVDNSPTILDLLAKVPVVRGITEYVVRHTFFAQFVGGDTALACLPVVRRLRSEQIGSLFSYSVEATQTEVDGVPVLRPYSERRKDAEDHVIEYIRAIVVSGNENKKWKDDSGLGDDVIGSCMVAVKMTGLISDPSTLQRASNTILAIRAAHPSSSSYVYYPGTPANTELALVDQPYPSIALPDIPDGVTAHDLSEIRLLHADLRKIMDASREYGVRVVIDAEHSWYQIAIDSLTTILAQEYNQLPGLSPQAKKSVTATTTDTVKKLLTLDKFEKEVVVAEEKENTYPAVQPLVYGTYQAYLRRNAAHLKESLIHAKEHNYSLGVKIVRGAYHGQETNRWIAAHPPTPGQPTLPPPVWQTKPETDACYNDGLNVLLDEIAKDVSKKERMAVPRIAAMFGTHNPESVAMVAAGLVQRGLARPSKELKDRVEGQRESDRESKFLEVGHETRKRVAVGQLYGMCDTITNATADTFSPHGAPIVLKYLPYGALAEVMPYLGRRAIENKTVLKGEGGAKAETDRVGGEMRRRWLGWDHYD